MSTASPDGLDALGDLRHQPLVRARGPPRRCRTRSRRWPGSRRRPCTRRGMSSQAARTGEGNSPDWLQKWQSSGQPPVLRLTMPSTSTSGPQCRIRTSWASCSSSGSRSSGSRRQASACSLGQADAALEHLLAGDGQDVGGWGSVGRRRGSAGAGVGSSVTGWSLPGGASEPGTRPEGPGSRPPASDGASACAATAPKAAGRARPAPAGARRAAAGRRASPGRAALLRSARSGSVGQAARRQARQLQPTVRERLQRQGVSR